MECCWMGGVRDGMMLVGVVRDGMMLGWWC